jgi:hypothetical protein
VCQRPFTTATAASSIKKALDLEWSDPEQKADALSILVEQLDALESWISEQLPEQVNQPPLAEHLETLRQLRNQDLEPDPSGGGPRIRRGVAEDRRVSRTVEKSPRPDAGHPGLKAGAATSRGNGS